MKKKKRIAFALAAALMMVLLLAACSDKTIRLGVAGTGGVYQVFGEDYAALQAQNGGQKLEVRETAGSAGKPAAVVQRVPADGGGTGGYGPGCLQPNRQLLPNLR